MMQFVPPDTQDPGLPLGWRYVYDESTDLSRCEFGDTGVQTPISTDCDQAVRDARIMDRQIRAGAYPEAHLYAFELDQAQHDAGEGKRATVALVEEPTGGDGADAKSATVASLCEDTGPDAPESPVAVKVHATEDRQLRPADGRARQLHQYVTLSTQVKAVALHLINDEKLYKRLGCGSFREYCEMEAGTPYRTGQLYASLGKQTVALYPALAAGMGATDGTPLQLTEGTGDDQDAAGALFDLGPSKLSLLFQHVDDEDDIRALASGETITLPSGREITLEEYGDMKRAEAVREFKRDRSKLQRRALKAEDHIDKLKAELESQRDTVGSAEKEIARAERERNAQAERAARLDAVYGGTAKRLEAKQATIGAARLLLNDANQALTNCGVEDTDPDELRQDIADLARKLSAIRDRFQERYAAVLSSLHDPI